MFITLYTKTSLLRIRLSGCHATLPPKGAAVPFGGALRDILKDGCEGDFTKTHFEIAAEVNSKMAYCVSSV